MLDVFIIADPAASAEQRAAAADFVRKRLTPAADRVVVVSNDAAKIAHVDVEQLNLGEVLPAAILDAVASRPMLRRELLCMALRRLTRATHYCVIDATGSPPLEPRALFKNERPILRRHGLYHFPHFRCFNYLFGWVPTPDASYCNDLLLIDASIVDAMTALIEQRYRMPWAELILKVLGGVAGTEFSFANCYGYFFAHHRRDGFVSNYSSADRASAALTSPARAVVRMSTLGHNGRFGNQLLQYAFVHDFAARNDLTLECPPWIGNGLFGRNDALTDRPLPLRCEPVIDVHESIRFDEAKDAAGEIDLWGFFQDARRWATRRGEFRSLFQPLPPIKSALDTALARLRNAGGAGRPLVAIHLRRGDFSGGPIFWPAPEDWYVRWLDSIWPKLNDPILYLASDEPAKVLPAFAKFNPSTAAQLGVNLKGAEFYSDFYVLTQCDALAISNSSFSFIAAMMNERAPLFVRPVPQTRQLERFDPWQSDVLLKWDNEVHTEPMPLAQAA